MSCVIQLNARYCRFSEMLVYVISLKSPKLFQATKNLEYNGKKTKLLYFRFCKFSGYLFLLRIFL